MLKKIDKMKNMGNKIAIVLRRVFRAIEAWFQEIRVRDQSRMANRLPGGLQALHVSS